MCLPPGPAGEELRGRLARAGGVTGGPCVRQLAGQKQEALGEKEGVVGSPERMGAKDRGSRSLVPTSPSPTPAGYLLTGLLRLRAALDMIPSYVAWSFTVY